MKQTLVTGTLPNILSVLNSGLPALEEADSCVVNNHLNATYVARRAFVKAESSDGKRWHGPCKVVGQLGTVVFVIHGSRLIRCTSCRMIKVPLSNAGNKNSDPTSTDKHVTADKSKLKEDISDDSELDISSESDVDDTEGNEE